MKAPMDPPRTLLWFRQDLRLADNPALHAAMARGAVVPVYLWTPHEEGEWPPGAASRWWLHHSLHALAADIAARGGSLLVRTHAQRGALELLQDLLRETGADGVCWNRRYEPAAIERDGRVKAALREQGLWVESFSGALLEEPWEVRNKAGGPFQVFTPYWRRALEVIDPAAPLHTPARWPNGDAPCAHAPDDFSAIDALELLPKIPWGTGMAAMWQPGEAGAARRLKKFLAGPVQDYSTDRNLPDVEGTSRLSPTCTSAKSHRARCGRPLPAPPNARTSPSHIATGSSSPSSAGASSRITCCSIIRTRRPGHCAVSSNTSPGRTMPPTLPPGSAAAPASRWWMPACASSGTRAGCITACA